MDIISSAASSTSPFSFILRVLASDSLLESWFVVVYISPGQ